MVRDGAKESEGGVNDSTLESCMVSKGMVSLRHASFALPGVKVIPSPFQAGRKPSQMWAKPRKPLYYTIHHPLWGLTAEEPIKKRMRLHSRFGQIQCCVSIRPWRMVTLLA